MMRQSGCRHARESGLSACDGLLMMIDHKHNGPKSARRTRVWLAGLYGWPLWLASTQLGQERSYSRNRNHFHTILRKSCCDETHSPLTWLVRVTATF